MTKIPSKDIFKFPDHVFNLTNQARKIPWSLESALRGHTFECEHGRGRVQAQQARKKTVHTFSTKGQLNPDWQRQDIQTTPTMGCAPWPLPS